jgi:hypothetical protein
MLFTEGGKIFVQAEQSQASRLERCFGRYALPELHKRPASQSFLSILSGRQWS